MPSAVRWGVGALWHAHLDMPGGVLLYSGEGCTAADFGVLGRRRANATFFKSHAVDRSNSIAFAMDLTSLVRDESLQIISYVDEFIERFRDEVVTKLQQQLGV